MSTADRLHSTVKSGVGGVKAHMKKLQENIKDLNEKADSMEKEKETTYRNYCKAMGQQQALKEKVIQTEEQIEKTERKLKEKTKFASEKEQFTKESEECNTRLKVARLGEGDADDIENQVKMNKDVYRENYEKLEKAKSLKIDLELRYEIIERKSRDVQRKVDELKLELQNNLVEEGRRTEGCKQTIDSAFKMEKHCLDVEKCLDPLQKRTENATKKITELQTKVTKAEDSLEAAIHERRRVEATIREVLKEQADKK